jgi:hypothetical protein
VGSGVAVASGGGDVALGETSVVGETVAGGALVGVAVSVGNGWLARAQY